MRFYLSSYKVGSQSEKLKTMAANTNKKVAVITNALDFSSDLARRRQSESSDLKEMSDLGFEAQIVDLRHYFGRTAQLEAYLKQFDIMWVRGGNVFVLRQAFALSGFDKILLKLVSDKNKIYGGFSAGVCVLGPTMKGYEIIDDPTAHPYPGHDQTMWDGVGILPFSFVPHYLSDHRETEGASKTVLFMKEHKMPFIALKDGDVHIIE